MIDLAVFQRRIESLANNRISGASELLGEALVLLVDLAQVPRSASAAYLGQCVVLLQQLRQAQPSMAPLLNLGSLALQLAKTARSGQEFSTRLKALAAGWRRSNRRAEREIAGELRGLLAHARRVVTYSRSGTVLAALGACRRSGLRFEICLSQGLPQMEGAAAAAAISGMGFPVTLTADAALSERLAGADAFLCGADAVTSQGIVNKRGTRALAQAARRRRIPVIVACTPDKFLLPQAEPLFRLGPHFDITSRRLVTHLLTGLNLEIDKNTKSY